MASFDAARLDSAQYDMNDPVHAIRLQNTVEDFVNVVRTNPTYIVENRQMIAQFCRLIDHDNTFPLAANVIPELRLPQSYDTTEDTIINDILGAPEIKRRRPPPPLEDAEEAAERDLVRTQTRAMLMHLEYGPAGEAGATQAEREECEDLIQRALRIILPDESNN